MSDLEKLIAAVAADWFAMDVLSPEHEVTAYSAFSGSLDAAHRLHDALLPGWKWGRLWDRHMWVEPDDMPGRSERHYGKNDTPARAWLLAILRAVKAQAAP